MIYILHKIRIDHNIKKSILHNKIINLFKIYSICFKYFLRYDERLIKNNLLYLCVVKGISPNRRK
jgi:hypothetical protein